MQLPTTTPASSGAPACGVSVDFQYPYQFYLPFTSLNMQLIMLNAGRADDGRILKRVFCQAMTLSPYPALFLEDKVHGRTRPPLSSSPLPFPCSWY